MELEPTVTMHFAPLASAMSRNQFMQRSDSRNHLPTSDSRQRLPHVETQRSISRDLSNFSPNSSRAREAMAPVPPTPWPLSTASFSTRMVLAPFWAAESAQQVPE